MSGLITRKTSGNHRTEVDTEAHSIYNGLMMRRAVSGKRLTTVSLALGAILLAYPAGRPAARQAVTDRAIAESVQQSRQEIAAFDASGTIGDAPDPRRKWAEYFWQYYEDHNDQLEGAQAAGRALRLLIQLKDYKPILEKCDALDPQSPAWSYGAAQALLQAYAELQQFQDLVEKAEGLIGVTSDPAVRDATRWALAESFSQRSEYDRAQPLLQALVDQSSDPAMLRVAKRALCELPYLRKNARDAARDSWQRPQQVLAALGIRRGSVVADIGAGRGYFTLRLAEAVQRAGKVYAVEIDPVEIAYLQAEAHRRRLGNVQVIRGTEGDPHLPKSACDVILFVDAYHEVKDRPAMLKQVKQALKRRGVLAIIDDCPPLGEDHFLREETILAEIIAAGFKLDRKETFLPAQFMLVFRK